MIVTAADLRVVRIDSKEIELKDGTIEQAAFTSVPMIRFRKSLTTSLTQGASPDSLSASNKNKTRTILIVNSSNLSEILTLWEIKNLLSSPVFPWVSARMKS